MSPANQETAAQPQLSLRAVLLGIVLSMVLAAANAYLGLFAGLTVSASIPAAVVSMAILRWFSTSGVLENNIVQTAASAGEAVAAGAIFTLPALILMEYWIDFEYLWVVFLCGVGGLLGVLMTVPLRHSLVDDSPLPFPEGQATAAVLRAGHGELGDEASVARNGVRLMLLGALVAAAAKLATSGLKLWQAIAGAGVSIGGTVSYIGANFSPALLAVGYIVGLNVAMLVFVGGVITWLIAVPLYAWAIGVEAGGDAAGVAMQLWSSKLRFMGVGAMLTGGLWALWSMRGTLSGGLRRSVGQMQSARSDLPPLVLLGCVAALAAAMCVYYMMLAHSFWLALPLTMAMVMAAFLFSAVAAYMAGLVGSSNNPISGVTIATILLTALGLKFTLGIDDAAGMAGPVMAVLVGAVVCCAAAIGGDNMQDLKAGALLGATPWKQQLAQMIGVVSAVLVLAPVMSLLLHAYGIGVPDAEHTDPLPAPQATLMAAVATGVFGGQMPWGMVGIGGLIAIAVIIVDEILRRRGSTVRAPVLAVAVGIYLPMKYTVPIAIGGLTAYWAKQKSGSPKGHLGTLLAAGLITGEALMGIALAVPIVFSGQNDVLRIIDPVLTAAIGAWPAVLLFVALCVWLGRIIPGQEQAGQEAP